MNSVIAAVGARYKQACNRSFAIQVKKLSFFLAFKLRGQSLMVTMVTMGGDLQPGCLADRLLTGLGQPQINP